MPLEGIDRKELERLAAAGAMVPASLLLAVVIRMEQLEEELAELKRNSRNSSKPPSSDRHNPSKPSDKKPGRLQGKKGKKRKPGGQKGHAGKSLRQVAHPDYIVEHRIDRRAGRCQHCESSLRGAKPVGVEKRQVFDLPESRGGSHRASGRDLQLPLLRQDGEGGLSRGRESSGTVWRAAQDDGALSAHLPVVALRAARRVFRRCISVQIEPRNRERLSQARRRASRPSCFRYQNQHRRGGIFAL